MMNKKAYTFGGWTEIIALSVLFVVLLGIAVVGMNDKYDSSEDPSFGMGIQEDANSSLNNLVEYQEQFQNSVKSGSASFTSVFGLVLSTSYDIIITGMFLFWTFISGSWIFKAVAMMQLPLILGTVFQVLYLLSIGFILLRILFKTWKV